MRIDGAVLLVLAAIGLGCYALLAALSAWYARVTKWQTPAGNQTNNWALRRSVGHTLGVIAVVVCAIGVTLWQVSWQMRVLTMVQAALLAAAGASDLQRFQLPLPLTLLGSAVAIASLLTAQVPLFYLIFGAIWVLVIITLHTLLSKGSMQLGDHIATIWIAIAAPVNGLIAIALGDAANVIFARVKGLQGKKVAAAGTWLIFATAIAAVPPYFQLLNSQAQTLPQSPVRTPVFVQNAATPQTSTLVKNKALVTPEEQKTAASLLVLADWAGQRTASVALADDHVDRVATARQQAIVVQQYAELAQQLAPDSDENVTLAELSGALNTFNLAAIRDASQKLALERERLAIIATSVVTTNTERVSYSMPLSHEVITAGGMGEKR